MVGELAWLQRWCELVWLQRLQWLNADMVNGVFESKIAFFLNPKILVFLIFLPLLSSFFQTSTVI